MVKVSFNATLAQKEVKKDAETLLAAAASNEPDAEAAVPQRPPSRTWCWCMCLGVALMMSGVLIGGVYLYRYYHHQQEDHVFFCGVQYREEDYMIRDEVEPQMPKQVHLRHLQEHIQVLEWEQVELIDVPVPEFEDGDPAKIVHDFQRGLTAYLDLSLNKCYIIPLNTSVVLPPRDMLELLNNLKAGTYLPQSYLVQEEMVVTERLQQVDQLGFHIYKLCRRRETFKLQRRDHILGMQKREALNCRKIRHFGSNVVMETQICEL